MEHPLDYVQLAHDYYDSHDAYQFYNVIFSNDHTGVGLYPLEQQDDKFLHGSGCDIPQALLNRNHQMLDLILKYSSNLHQISLLELGSGRGGLSRFIWKSLNQNGRLAKVTCVNLVEKENNYNRRKSQDDQIQNNFEIYTMNFENLAGLQKDHFDIVISNDCILHCSDLSKVFSQVQQVLKPQGHYIFTEYVKTSNPNSIQQLQQFCKSFNIRLIYEENDYISNAQNNGLVLVDKFYDNDNFRKHQARIRYDALNSKKDQLQENVSSSFYENLIQRQEMWIQTILDGNIGWGWFTFIKQP